MRFSVPRYGFVSDIHGDLNALDGALKLLPDATQLFCLGDVAGGPAPSACLERLAEHEALSVYGNHDHWEEDLVDLSPEERRHLADLPLQRRVDNFLMMHSHHTKMSEYTRFHYVRNVEAAQKLFDAESESLIFIGHTHEPAFYEEQASGQILKMEIRKTCSLLLDDTSRYVINVGQAALSAVLYEPDRRCVRFRLR